MRFWIECTSFETGQTVHINIALVGSMSRDGERTVLAFVGDGQTIDVTETPEQILEHASRPDGQGVTQPLVIPGAHAACAPVTFSANILRCAVAHRLFAACAPPEWTEVAPSIPRQQLPKPLPASCR